MKHDCDSTSTTSTFMPLSSLSTSLSLSQAKSIQTYLRLACHSGIRALTPSMSFVGPLAWPSSCLLLYNTSHTQTLWHTQAVSGKSRAWIQKIWCYDPPLYLCILAHSSFYCGFYDNLQPPHHISYSYLCSLSSRLSNRRRHGRMTSTPSAIQVRCWKQ